MLKQVTVALFLAGMWGTTASAQEKPALVVHAFTVAGDLKFPYDMTELRTIAIKMLQSKNAEQFDAAPDVPPNHARVYTLDGEVLEWHKGNAAERLLIAAGSVAGRENAKIHYWVTDANGKKIFEQTDMIRQGWMKNGHEKNVGMLKTPFAEKLSERLKEAKLTPDSE